MKSTIKTLVAGAIALAVTAGPVAAQTGRQKDKNNMRNLGAVLGAAAAHQAVKGKTTNALVLGAGAAYSAKKYEDARKAQSKENARYSDSGGNYRVYRYSNGRKVGYYKYVNGKRVGYYRLASR